MEKNNKVNESHEQNNKNQNDLLIKSKFVKEFTKTFLAWKDRNRFIKEIMEKESIDDSELLKRKLQNFKAYTENDDLKNFDESKINIADLRKEVVKEYTELNNLRYVYLNFLENNYELVSKELEFLERSDDFNRLTKYQLENLLKNEKSNIDFISSILKKKINVRNDINIFDSLTDKKIESRLNEVAKKDPELAHNLKIALLNISEWKANNQDFKYLFSSWLLNFDEKKQLLEKFFPYITFSQAKKYWLLSDEELEKYKDITFDIFIRENVDLNQEEQEKLKDVLNIDNLKISIKELSDNINDANLDSIVSDYNFTWVSESINDTFKEAKEKLKEESNIELLKNLWIDIEKIKKWAIIEIIIPEKDEDWEDTKYHEKYFFEIKDISDKELELKDIWKNDDIHYQWEKKAFSYKELSTYINKEKAKVKVFSKKEFKDLVTDEASEFDVDSSFEFVKNIDSITGDEKNEIINWLIDEYTSQKLDLEKKLSNLRSWLWEYTGLSEDEKNKKEKLLLDKIEFLDKKIVKLKQWEVENEEILEDYNFNNFLDNLNLLDKQWKDLGFEKWIFIEMWKGLFEWQWWGSYEIIDLDKTNWIITLNSIAWREQVDYENFLRVVKKQKAKRTKKITNFNAILNDKLNNNLWKDLEIKDGELIQKEVEYNNKKEDRKIEYLVSNENNELVKINDINWDKVLVQFGEVKDLDKDEKKAKKYSDKDKVNEIKLWDETEISLNELNKYIDDFKLYPDWKLWQKSLKTADPLDVQNDIKWKFSTRLFNRYSISELIAGWKMMVAWIEDSLKRWNDIHAAKFALALWSILPEEIRADLKIKVEREEAEAMDKAIDWLSKVDSPIATRRIKEWLLNKNTPEYKKEAGLMFMLQKYGVLYAKELTEFQWKFLWYEAFWGRIWDELYNDIKAESERNNVPFSEEKLMHMLLKRQCKWVLKPERRSRLHKDYEWKWKSWVSEEFEKWYKDASKKRNATEMVKWWMDEAFGWTIPNALWWFKKAVERWDGPEVMSEWFFSLMYSWILGQQDENLLVEIKNLWDSNWLPVIMIRFASNKWDIDFFNKTVLNLAKRMQEIDSNRFPKIYDEAKEIFDDMQSWKWTEKDRLDRTQKFWKKYWKALSKSLYFQDVWKSETSKTDKVILLEKDTNPIFWEYYNKVRAFTWIWWAFNKELMDDESGEHWLAWLNHKEIIKRFFRMDSWRSIPSANISVVERLWWKLSEDINSINDKNMEISWNDDLINKRKYLKLIFRDIFSWFVTNHPDATFLKKYVEASPFKDDMRKWWVDEKMISRFLEFSAGEIEAGSAGADEIIDEIIDNILLNKKVVRKNDNPVFATMEEIIEKTDSSLNK